MVQAVVLGAQAGLSIGQLDIAPMHIVAPFAAASIIIHFANAFAAFDHRDGLELVRLDQPATLGIRRLPLRLRRAFELGMVGSGLHHRRAPLQMALMHGLPEGLAGAPASADSAGHLTPGVEVIPVEP